MSAPDRTSVVRVRRAPYDVYAGRPKGCLDPRDVRPGDRGFLGNPYTIGPDGTRAQVIDRYRRYFLERVEHDPAFRAAVEACRGLTLGCFCKPKACHADVIAAWLDREARP